MTANATLTPMYHFSLDDLQEIETFHGHNFYNWYRDLRIVLKNEQKLYILKGPIPEQPLPTSWSDHDAWWKHYCDAIDVSHIMLGTMIPDLQKALENYEAYQMFRQVKQIYQQNSKTWFKPVQTLDASKVEESHNVCSKRPMVQKREINKRQHNIPKKSRKGPKDGSCFYCGETGHWKRNCSSYLTELKKSGKTSTSGIYMIELFTFHHTLKYMILHVALIFDIMCRCLEEVSN